MRKNRPKAILCNAAASNRNGRAQLLACKDGRFSSIEPGYDCILKDVYSSESVEGYIDVPCTTLDTLLGLIPHYAQYGIDLVVIDTEGHDLAVLQGFDLKKWRPRLLLIEQAPFNQLAGQDKIRAVDKYMVDASYVYLGHSGPDSYYAWKASDIIYWQGDEVTHDGKALVHRWFGEEEDDARILLARQRQAAESKRV
jgi:FkbM family methyltransferase